MGHFLGHPCFRGHSRRHFPGDSGPKGPRDPCSLVESERGGRFATLIPWYNPRILDCPKSIGEGATSLLGGRPGSPGNVFCSRASADCKRGRRKGATSKNVKNRQKVSKIFSTLFDSFRAGQKTSKIVKKCQKVFRHFSTIFARHLFSGPFCNPLSCSHQTCTGATLGLL